MLRVTGHNAALLDGGIQSYPGTLEVGSPEDHLPPGSPFVERPWPSDCIAGIDDAADPANLVIDARAPERFRGDEEPVDARPGHIPGARNLPCRSNLDQDGCFLPAEELRRRFESVGAAAATPVISYCGSGVTACHILIALELAGMGPGRLYPGSWSQYSHDFSRLAEAGAGRQDQ
jgi:thiosulfate/3-mercaptopyruvate sulfurtransferase